MLSEILNKFCGFFTSRMNNPKFVKYSREEILNKFYRFFFGENGDKSNREKENLKFIKTNGRSITLFNPLSFAGEEFGGKNIKGEWVSISLSEVSDIISVPKK